jgi:hypothetical protein
MAWPERLDLGSVFKGAGHRFLVQGRLEVRQKGRLVLRHHPGDPAYIGT